jgi:hypothetical protein
VARSRGQRCGDIELAAYLAAGPLPLVLDLRMAHERFGSISDPSINGHLHYPNDLDGPLNDAAADKIRQYRADYNNRPCRLSPLCLLLLVRLGVYIVNLCAFYFYKLIGKLTAFLQLQEFSLRNLRLSLRLTLKPVWCLSLRLTLKPAMMLPVRFRFCRCRFWPPVPVLDY